MAHDRGPVLTLTGHLEELRRRLALSVLALVIGVGIGTVMADRIVGWLLKPATPFLWRLAFFTPTEPLLAYLNVAILAGVVLAMPVLLWQLWIFVSSGLTKQEQSLGVGLIGWGSGQFVLGLACAYFLIVPLSLRILFSIGHARLEPIISIEAYLGFATTIMWWCGVIFELPVVLFILAKLGIVTPEWLRQSRGYAILALSVVAALVTPTTDMVSLLLVLVPMILLYELSIIVTRFATRVHP